FGCRGHRRNHPHLVDFHVLFAVRDDDVGTDHQRGRVEAALADVPMPYRFAGGDLDRVHCAVAATGEEQTRAVHVGDVGVGVDRVSWSSFSHTHPQHLPSFTL